MTKIAALKSYTLLMKPNCPQERRRLTCDLQVRGPYSPLVVWIKAQSIRKYETHQPWLEKRSEAAVVVVIVVIRAGEMEE